MDRRQQPRLSFNQPVEITTLSDPPRTLSGRAVDLSGAGMRVFLAAELPPGTLVRIDTPGMLLLGEVCWTRAVDAGIELGLKLQHALAGIEELERLNRGLWQEFAPPVVKTE
ncbi:MAG: PilZ domain-containing protein [Bryobacteraceae bacterium]|nr:PilZ domain-containing protein [Bryobacteraceae bacterium]